MVKRALSLMINIVLLLCLMLAFPTITQAESSTNNTIFTIPDNDTSTALLGNLFGTIGESGLEGNGQYMPKLFKALNSIILGLGSIVVMFTLIVSTLNSAHEGETLGKAWGSYWVPIRTVLGIGAILPIQSGYSLLQAFIMWMILHGIGAANYLWSVGANIALNTPTDATPQALATAGVSEAGHIFRVLACMHAVNKINQNGNIRIVINPSLLAQPLKKDKQYKYKIGSTQMNNGVDEDGCGEISWPAEGDEDLQQARLDATRLLISSLSISALNLIEFGPNYVNLADLVNASTHYTNQINQVLLTKQESDDNHVEKLLERGWIVAGAFYYDLVQQNNQFKNNQKLPRTKDKSRHVGIGSDQSLLNQYLANADNYISAAASETGLQAAEGEGVSVHFTAFNTPVNAGDQAANSSIKGGLSSLSEKLNFVVGWWQSFFTGNGDEDPLLKIQSAGSAIVTGVEIIWIGTSIIAMAMGMASVLTALNPTFNILQNFTRWFIPLFTGFLGFLYLSGAVLAYYIPLIPFILFSFGALGWLFGIIEAITAAPIVALGIIYAGGDQTLGKSEPAILLLVDLILRPSLMVIGLLAAIVMVRIGIHYVNLGFSITGGNVFAGGISYLTSVISLIIMYSILMVITVQFCFKLIYLVPNRVMRWIGGQADAFESGKEDEKATREGFEKGHEEFGKLGSEAATGKKTMKHATGGFGAGKEMQKAGKQGLQTGQSGGGGGGAASGEAADAAAES